MVLMVLIFVLTNMAIDLVIFGGFLYQRHFDHDNCKYECLGNMSAENSVKLICSLQTTVTIGWVLFLLVPLGQLTMIALYLCGFGCVILYGVVRGCCDSIRHLQSLDKPTPTGIVLESE